MKSWPKKIIIITCLLLISLCLFTAIFQWRFEPSKSFWYPATLPSNAELDARVEQLASKLRDDNAAKYYLKATFAMVEPQDYELVWDVLENRKQDVPRDLRSVMQQNEPAFELIRTGTKQPYCSLPKGEELEKCNYCYLDFRTLARLMAVESARREN